MLNTQAGEYLNNNTIVNANDLRIRSLNIDSRFRVSPLSSTTDFDFRFPHTYKNIISARVSSIEIPNLWYNFSPLRHNTSFKITAYDISNIERSTTITIESGSYTTPLLEQEIQSKLDDFKYMTGIYINYTINPISIRSKFEYIGVASLPIMEDTPPTNPPSKPLIIDFSNDATCGRRCDFGLGYYLGFRCLKYVVAPVIGKPLSDYTLTSESLVDVVGDLYILLHVGDFKNIEHKTGDNYIQCMTKILVAQDKGALIVEDSTLMNNQVILPSPIDLKQIPIRLTDAYDQPIDLMDMNWSMTLEIIEVTNLRLYEFYRNYLWTGKLPSMKQSVKGSEIGGMILTNTRI
jgi:hypothetical protein